METIQPRAGFLSNFEVLAALKSQRDARSRQIKSLDSWARFDKADETNRIQPENLHTVTFESIKYLEDDVHPLRKQTSASVAAALTEMVKLNLKKSDRLQLINLAPKNLCELTVCVEDFEERFAQEHDLGKLLGIIRRSQSDVTSAASITVKPTRQTQGAEEVEEEEEYEEEDEEFVNEGLAGAGEAQVRELDEED